MGVHRPPQPPHQFPLESVASYLCHFMLTCDIPMTRNNDAGQAGIKLSSLQQLIDVYEDPQMVCLSV